MGPPARMEALAREPVAVPVDLATDRQLEAEGVRRLTSRCAVARAEIIAALSAVAHPAEAAAAILCGREVTA